MLNKNLICFSFILLILLVNISFVSAQDNNTQTLQENTISVNEEKSFEDVQIAIDSANENDTVELEGEYLSHGNAINISKSITIKSEKGAILNANNKSPILNITKGNVFIKNINFINSQSKNTAAITSDGNLTVEDCYFKNNRVEFNYTSYLNSITGYYEYNPTFNDDHGGAIYSSNSLNVYNSTFENNYVDGYEKIIQDNFEYTSYQNYHYEYGGGIGSTGNLFVSNSTFMDSLITCNIKNSTFVNTLFKKGHKILYSKSNITLIDCNFEENDGFLIDLDGENIKLIIDNCNVTNNIRNSTYGDYTLIRSFSYPSYICISNSNFKNNNRSIVLGDHVFVENSNFENNTERTVIDARDVEVINSTFINNSNPEISGITANNISLTNCNFINNSNPVVNSHNIINIDGEIYTGEKTFDNSLKLILYIAIPPLDNASDDGSVIISLPNDASGIITLDINNNNYYFAVVNGVANIFVPLLSEGNYSYTITYSGDSKYSSYNANNYLIVNNSNNIPIENNITVIINGEKYSSIIDNSTVVIDVPIDNNMTVVVDGKEYPIVIVNGTATITTNKTEPELPSTIVVDGISYPFVVKNGTATITTNKTDPVKQISTVIYSDYSFTRVANDYAAGERGDFFYAVLKDVNGKPLPNMVCYVAVNGPIYNVTTDSQGRFGVQVNLAAANTYTYALSFLGNDKYGASFNCSKLILTAKKTSITAKTQTFKAKTKTKTIYVTLKTVKNSYDGKTYLKAGKKIILKINGKTYTTKTNDKGIAKFTIKLNKKGKYTATVKFVGDKTYESSNNKLKIVIK